MRIDYMKVLVWARWAGISFASFVIATVVGGFVLQLCSDADWYKHPWATVADVIVLIETVLFSTAFHWLGGGAIGFVGGIWLDDILRKFAARAAANPPASPQKGFLDYQIDLEVSGKQIAKVLQKITCANLKLVPNLEKHTAKVLQLADKAKLGGNAEDFARKARTIADDTANSYDTFSATVAKYKREFSDLVDSVVRAVNWLSENQVGWRSEMNVAQMKILKVNCEASKESLLKFIEALNGTRGVSANLNAAVDRAKAQQFDLVETMDRLISVCDGVLSKVPPLSC